jgi:hypothetical protein
LLKLILDITGGEMPERTDLNAGSMPYVGVICGFLWPTFNALVFCLEEKMFE